MPLLRALARGLRRLVHRDAVDREEADEIAHFLDESARDHLAPGVSPADAHLAARRAVGGVTTLRETVGRQGWENVVSDFAADVRHALRRLRRAPAYAGACVLTLALGIGASTAIFSVVRPILFAPLAYPHAERVVALADRAGGPSGDVTYGTYQELLARSRSFEHLAVADYWRPGLTGIGDPERLDGDRVTASYFRTVGVAPAIGRDFDEGDEQPGARRVAVLSDAFVRRRFGRRDAALGRDVQLDGQPYTVVGVMPPGFENVMAPSAVVWAPARYRARAPFQGPEWGHHFRMLGRLAPGITLEGARRELDRIARDPAPGLPRPTWAALESGMALQPLRDEIIRPVRPALLAILGAVVLLLIIACVNVTNLVLVRAAQREGEMAMRAALGAGRLRIMRQLLTESLVLSAIGGLLGCGAAAFGTQTLLALAPAELPRAADVRLDGAALAFALLVTVAVSVAVGIVPARQAARADLRSGSGALSRAAVGTRHALRRSLVAAELALAVVLLVSAGLLLRSLERLFAVPPGFDPAHLLTMQVVIVGPRYDSDDARIRFLDRASEAVRRLPGVTDVAYSSQLPLSGEFDGYGIDFGGIPRENDTDIPSALRGAVSAEWFRAMRIPLRRGRLIDATDRPGGPVAVVISETFARRTFGDRDPIGQPVRIGPGIGRTDRPPATVVGVVGDVTQTSLADGPTNAFYVAADQWDWVDRVHTFAVRVRGDPASIAPSVVRAIWSVDADQPIARISTMDALVARSEAERRFVLTVFEAFALAALVLGAVGIFGVLSATVRERTREIGVRVALGASRGSVLALVLRQGLSVVGVGAALGLVASLVATRAVATLLYGVTTLDPLTYLGVLAVLAAAAAVACWAPASRAAAVDPMVAMRME